jgi:hypothetical protein
VTARIRNIQAELKNFQQDYGHREKVGVQGSPQRRGPRKHIGCGCTLKTGELEIRHV